MTIPEELRQLIEDAQLLLRSRVDFTRMTGPTIAECWLLDAANHLNASPTFDGHQRASVLWPNLVAVPAREEAAA